YIKRLEKLEEVTSSFPGVEKSYAIQAGREVRIMVKPDQVSEDQMVLLARDIAKKIEEELEYPGQIKVNMIRETKVIEYAKYPARAPQLRRPRLFCEAAGIVRGLSVISRRRAGSGRISFWGAA